MKNFLFLLFLCTTAPVFAEIRAEIEPDQVNLGDSFQLILTTDGVTAHQTPDLLPLQRDFEINSTEHRVSTTIINGQMETLNQWAILLTPKRAGTLNIPPIRMGQEESQALTIGVSAQGRISNAQQKQQKPISFSHEKRLQIKTEITPKDPYVNQEILLTIKLIHQDQLLDAHYQPPNLEEALMLPLGDSEQYQLVEKNQIFTVEEQRYALFPQKPGEQLITGAQFQALVYRGLPERMQARGKPALLHIKPIPKTIQAEQWLPAKALSFTEEYSDSHDAFQVGKTLTRTIKIEARALPAELLPTLKADIQDHFGVYPEKPILKNSIHKQDVAGIKTVRITYLLNQPGEIKLPSYKLTWFNTKTGKEEIAELPEKVLHITGEEVKRRHTSPLDARTQKTTASFHPKNQASWFLALGLGIAWIIALMVFLFFKKHPSTSPHQKDILKSLKDACKHHDPSKAREALLQMARARWPESRILNLDGLKQHIDDPILKNEIEKLSQALYAKHINTPWQGTTLWNTIKKYRKKRNFLEKPSVLPHINPKN